MSENPKVKELRESNEQVPAWLLLDWLMTNNRKPAITAFTEGPLRQLAYFIEREINNASVQDARRYAALRETLQSQDGSPGMGSLHAPVIVPFNDPAASGAQSQYLREGLDKACDDLIHQGR